MSTATLALATGLVAGTVHGAAESAEKVGVIALALLAGVVVLGRPPRIPERARALALLAALVLTPVLLLIEISHASQVEHLRHHPALAAAAVVAALVLVAALTLLFHRRPQAFALAVVLTAPFRLPISTEGSSADLLIPLYLVIGAGALAELVPALLRAPASAPPAPRPRESALQLGRPTRAQLPVLLEWALVAFVLVYALQASYSGDFTKALENMVFFYVPFALMLARLRRLQWTPGLLRNCFALAVALAVLMAGVGFVELAAKRLLLNHQLVTENDFNGYFRVNSLFYDPNIYGRFLALVMIAVATIVLERSQEGDLRARRRTVVAGALVLIWLWAGLVTSFSQSSIAALLLGLAILAGWRWGSRRTLYISLAAVVLAGAFFAVLVRGSLNNETNGRANLIQGGVDLFAERPLEGFGSGSFATEYKHRESAYVVTTTESHTMPVTVAAEQGLIGLAFYLALLVLALATLFAGAGRSPPRILIGACFAALLLHTFAYADFLEDPITWLLLGVGLALATAQPLAPAEARA